MLPELQPDPDWNYSEIWNRLQESRAELDALIQYMANQEEANPALDKVINSSIDLIEAQLNTARRLLRS